MRNLLLFTLGAIHGIFVHKNLGYALDTFHFWFLTILGSIIIYLIVDEFA